MLDSKHKEINSDKNKNQLPDLILRFIFKSHKENGKFKVEIWSAELHVREQPLSMNQKMSLRR